MDKPDKTLRRTIMTFLLSYLRPDIRFFLAAAFCAAGVAGMSAWGGYLLKPFADLMGSDKHALVNQSTYWQIVRISLEVVAIYGVRWFFTYGDSVYFAEAGQRLSVRLRDAIYAHLQGMSMRYFNDQRTGAMMSTINNDLPILQGALTSLKDAAVAPWQLLFGLWLIFHISVPLSLAALVMFPFMAFTISYFTRLIRSLTLRTQDKLADVNSLLSESLSGIRIIQSFSAEKHEIKRFRQINQESKDIAMSNIRIQAKLKPTNDLIGAIGIAVALSVAGSLVAVQHKMSLGDLLEFIYMLNLIASGVGTLGNIKGTWESVMAAGERIWLHVLSVESDVQNAPDAIDLGVVEGTVELRHVAFSYRPDTPVLRDISFVIQPGEVIALVGLSGAGKSTIADLVPRFYDPQEGAVLLDGHDIRTVTIESLRRQIGIVPQETILFGGSIRDNIAYGDPAASDAMIEAAARAANAHHFICEELSDGYETRVGERGKQLSGGQRQRIAIARALLKNPRILILDEATSSLDARSERAVQEALDVLMKGRTTLVIAHRLSTIVNAHKIVVLDAGKIVEMGTHADLIARVGGHYSQLYRRFAEEPSSVLAAP
jgi:subfamily B ATP-binding cassette protein MsbA